MSAPESLKTFLKEKIERDQATGRLSDRNSKISLRSKKIGELFDEIESWLQSSVDDKIVSLQRDPYFLLDKQLGSLSEESLTVSVGASEVSFAPCTGSIAGASIRVDMKCNERTLPIILLSERGWHFLLRQQVTRTEPVTEESFTEALKELLEG